MRLIDADGVYQETLFYSNRFRKSVLKIINALPTVEPQRGHWVREHYNDYGHDYIREKCSLCGQVGSYNYIYCPYCGAKMDEKEQENE